MRCSRFFFVAPAFLGDRVPVLNIMYNLFMGLYLFILRARPATMITSCVGVLCMYVCMYVSTYALRLASFLLYDSV